MRVNLTRKLTTCAFLAALSIVLAYIIRFPIFPAVAFLEYEPADVPIFIAAFLFGPWWGIGITIVVSAIQAMTVSASSGVIGFAMHVFATGAFVLVAGFMTRKNKSTRRMVEAFCAGTLTMVALMIPLNLIFTPMYGVPLQTVKDLMLPFIVPFNLIKAGANAAISCALCAQLRRVKALQPV